MNFYYELGWVKDAQKSRQSFSFYTDPDGNVDRRPFILTVFLFLLRSVCLTLQVFLHNRIGKRYITEPKALVGCIFPYLCLFLAQIQFAFVPEINFLRPYAVEIVTPFVEAMHSARWDLTKARLEQLYNNLADSQLREDTLEPVTITAGLFGFVINFRFLLAYVSEHFLRRRRHPYSSGDPYIFWDIAYFLCWRFNIRVDVVKSFLEPALCFGIGCLILESPSAEHGIAPWRFLGIWLIFGSLALGMQAYLESHKRHKVMLDQLANQMNAEAFQAQEQMTSPMKRDGFDVVPASGRV